jgi:hypothetical protein
MQQRPSRLRDCLLISIWAASSFLLSSEITAQQDAARPQPPPPQDIGAAPGHLPKVHYVPSRAPEMTYPLWASAISSRTSPADHRPVRAITRERLGLRRARWYAGGIGLVAGSIIRVPRE